MIVKMSLCPVCEAEANLTGRGLLTLRCPHKVPEGYEVALEGVASVLGGEVNYLQGLIRTQSSLNLEWLDELRLRVQRRNRQIRDLRRQARK